MSGLPINPLAMYLRFATETAPLGRQELPPSSHLPPMFPSHVESPAPQHHFKNDSGRRYLFPHPVVQHEEEIPEEEVANPDDVPLPSRTELRNSLRELGYWNHHIDSAVTGLEAIFPNDDFEVNQRLSDMVDETPRLRGLGYAHFQIAALVVSENNLRFVTLSPAEHLNTFSS